MHYVPQIATTDLARTPYTNTEEMAAKAAHAARSSYELTLLSRTLGKLPFRARPAGVSMCY